MSLFLGGLDLSDLENPWRTAIPVVKGKEAREDWDESPACLACWGHVLQGTSIFPWGGCLSGWFLLSWIHLGKGRRGLEF